MKDIVVSCNNLSKTFHQTRKSNEDFSDSWVLKDVSFDLYKGDAIALIGKNGAGKSTLLKILSNIMPPSSGKAIINGSYASILDVGNGFHPDLSGRENIDLYQSLISPHLKANIEEIIAFSELEDFMNLPIKHYSNGMYLRLAFSIAIHTDTDLILLDEVLAVGDNSFRNKCYQKIIEKRLAGCTFIIASHAMNDILKLCNKGLWINKSHANIQGSVGEVVSKYLESLNAEIQLRSTFIPNQKYDNEYLDLKRIKIYSEQDEDTAIFQFEDKLTIELQLINLIAQNTILPVIELEDENSAIVAVLGSIYDKEIVLEDKRYYKLYIQIPHMLINTGLYTINIRILKKNLYDIIYQKSALFFRIIQNDIEKNKIQQANPFSIVAGESKWMMK